MASGWYDKLKHSVRFWLLRRLPTCKQTVEVISQSLDRPLTVRERVLLKTHLWVCVWCFWYLEHLQKLRSTLRAQGGRNPEMDFPTSATLSEEARERIKRKLSGGTGN